MLLQWLLLLQEYDVSYFPDALFFVQGISLMSLFIHSCRLLFLYFSLIAMSCSFWSTVSHTNTSPFSISFIFFFHSRILCVDFCCFHFCYISCSICCQMKNMKMIVISRACARSPAHLSPNRNDRTHFNRAQCFCVCVCYTFLHDEFESG